jgi:hypothetical protein
MDIAGARALKERLDLNEVEAPSVIGDADVAEDAPPVYHWVGVSQRTSKPSPVDEEPATPNASLFRRLVLSFR